MPLPPYDLIKAAWDNAVDDGVPRRKRSFLADSSLFPTERDGVLVLRVGVPYAIAAEQLEDFAAALGSRLGSQIDMPAEVRFQVDRALTLKVAEGLERTKAEEVARMVREVQESEIEAATASGTIGFWARIMAQASLPYVPVPGTEWVRRNGRCEFRVLSGSDTGLPFGALPRLLICHFSTQ
ncbi:MAG: hypothetical protein ACYDGR_06705, partial [Candidatus Dormibacteria bacterium]